MDDSRLIEKLFARDESALEDFSRLYGSYCRSVAYNILENDADAEECLNDTVLRIWSTIPPQKPSSLKHYAAKIARNLAFDRYRASRTERRGGGEIALCLDECAEIISDGSDVAAEYERERLIGQLNAFLRSLPDRERRIFIRRYFYCDSVRDIARRYSLPENQIPVILSRTRKKLKKHLEKGGYSL